MRQSLSPFSLSKRPFASARKMVTSIAAFIYIGACCDEAIFEEGVEDYYQVSHSGTVAGHVFKYYMLLPGAEAGVSVYEVL